MEKQTHSYPLGIMGDPHGHYEETLKLLKSSGYINLEGKWNRPQQKLICVGDYVDRGPDGIKTIELFMDLQREAGQSHVIPLLGNHDVLLLSAYYLGHQKSGGPGGNFYDDWVMNGGQQEDLERLDKGHIEWLRDLPAMTLIDDILVAHADSSLYLNYGKSITEVNETFRKILHHPDPNAWDLLLERFSDRLAFYNEPASAEPFLKTYGGKILVHGHTAISYMTEEDPGQPLLYANEKCINVDACAYRGNPLIMQYF